MVFSNHIFRNFSSLTAINFINLLLPIITIPYLVRSLGVANYGVLAFHQYVGQFILVLLDFGFPLYAISEVARRRDDKSSLIAFISDVYLVKHLLLLSVTVGVVIIIGLSRLFHWSGISGWMLFVFMLVSAFNSFAPTWLFQGLDMLQRTILPTLFARIVTLILTLILVREPNDIWLAPLPYLFGAVVLFLLLGWQATQQEVRISIRASANIRRVMSESLQVFWSRLTIMGYVTVSPVMINLAVGMEGVAVYNLCEKVVAVARMPFDMLSAAAYTRFSREYHSATIRRFFIPLGAAGLVFALAISVVAPMIVTLLGISKLASMQQYLAIYGVALIPISMHGFIGTCVLLPNGKRLELAKSIIVGLLAYLLCMASLWNWIDNKIALAIASMVIVEFGIFFSRLLFSIKYRLI